MTRYTFTILDEHYQMLKRLLLRDSNEFGALLLCGRSQHVDPWTGLTEERALVREVIEVEEAAFIERTPVSMTWTTDALFLLAKKAMAKDLAICIAHSHPTGGLFFSPFDDVADRESFDIIYSRMDTTRPHFSLVMDDKGDVIVRAFESELKPHLVELVRVIGNRFRIFYPDRGKCVPAQEFDRHVRAFGAESVQDLAQLRIGIVGCGGTGSAIASLVARLAPTRLVLFDDDIVDHSNLNRLHFSKRSDAIQGRYKVDVVAEAIAEIGLVQSVVRVRSSIEKSECRDALRACDVIFGCTDDHLGRNVLNRLAHFYLIPVIDLGLLIEPNDGGGYSSFDGRVTVVQPGHPCQVCRQLISSQKMLEESMRRNDPQMFDQHRKAGYVTDGAAPNPVVVTFTSEIAAMAVNELLHRLTGFRGSDGQCAERVRRLDWIKDADTVPGGISRSECPLCGKRKYDGRGDMTPFLDMA
ncbi:MAG: ThiF family adenylyltransferase [Georgfuchsia sp.]